MSRRAVERLRPSIPAPSRRPAPRAVGARDLWISLALLVLTVVVYAPVRNFGFISLDDPESVSDNRHVRTGLTRDNIVWAWTEPLTGTWQQPIDFFAPLTSMSHLLDVQLFGVNPGPHHLTNVVLHALNTVLLFILLSVMTAQAWRSAFVAALFAVHPLHVESVAWITERKDVLSTTFWMLTMLAYVGYTRRPGRQRYLLLFGAYVAALLSKPMVVTLPLVLLLLDVWPLRRIAWVGSRALPANSKSAVSGSWFLVSGCVFSGIIPNQGPETRDQKPTLPDCRAKPGSSVRTVVTEKLPLLLLAGAALVVAFIIRGRAVPEVRSVGERLGTALVSYVTYLGTMCWPARLAILYPFQPPSLLHVAAAAVLLAGITAVALWGVRQYPYLFVGWFWYVITLAPVSGLVQLGNHIVADRYTYVPLIGIFVMVSWGVADVLARRQSGQIVGAAAAGAVLLGCTVVTTHHLPLWRDSLTLFQDALRVTPDNLVAQSVVGNNLLLQGRPDEAWEHFNEVIRLSAGVGVAEPYYSDAQANLGLILVRRGDLEAAKLHYVAALAANPAHAKAHTRFGMILARQGDTQGALAHYRDAVRAAPDLAAAHNNLAITLEDLGELDEALTHYAEGVRLEPQNAESRCNWAAALAKAGHLPDAIAQFRSALQLKPQLAEAHVGLAAAYAQLGQMRTAIDELDAQLRQRPDSPAVEVMLAWLLATADDGQVRDGARALQLAEDADRRTNHENPDVLNALAAAYAETGRFSDAVDTGERALAAAQRNGQLALRDALPARLVQYRAGQPVRDRPRGAPAE